MSVSFDKRKKGSFFDRRSYSLSDYPSSSFDSANFTAPSSSLTSLASTLSENINEVSRSTSQRNNSEKFASVLSCSDWQSVADTTVETNEDCSRVENWQPNLHKPEWNKGHAVVVIRAAQKGYGSKKNPKVVLDKLNLTIKEGSIYALLGASGCGKTTVLSTLVGLKTLDKGVISVFGGVPGDRSIGVPGKRIGYMPQELALYGEFTINETLQYFGRIYGMSREAIKKQADFLIDFLDLSKCGSFIRNMSGGQQRRVSFAVALLHNPELLILDEPTVGVDPMLRQNIWSHLLKLSTELKKTVLITTHYIEEARQAHYVGLMRNGKLLAEDSPTQLLTIYGLPTLEDVFLKLCVKDDSLKESQKPQTLFQKGPVMQSWTGSVTSRKSITGVVYPGITAHSADVSIQPISYCAKNPSQKLPAEEAKAVRIQRKKVADLENDVENDSECNNADDVFEPTKKRPWCSVSMPSPTTLLALMIKNIIKMMRNFMGLAFVFFLPALEVFFFCIAVGRDPTELPLAIINHEVPAMSNCTFSPGCEFANLSCRMVDYFRRNETFQIHMFDDEAAALEAAKENLVWGYVSFHANFSESFLARLWNPMDISQATRNDSTAQIYLDMSNQQVAFAMHNRILEGYSNFMTDLLGDCNMPKSLADIPLKFNEPVYGSTDPSFTEFMAPGIIIIIIFFLAVGLTGEAFIAEKSDGLLDRSWVAGVLPIEVMTSHILTQFIVLIGQTTITLVFIFLVFGIPCKGPIGWLILIAILQGFTGMCFGFLLSTLFSQQTTAMQCAIGSFYPMLLLSGILWPIEGMPYILRKISWYLPCTAACQAMRDIMGRGWGIDAPSVPLGIGVSVAWIAIFIITSWLAMRFIKH